MTIKEIHPLLPAALRRVGQYFDEAHRTLLALRWEASSSTPYGATNGRALYLNPAGLAEWDETEPDTLGALAFLLVHEARHVDLLHPLRFKGLVHDLANQAGDFVINGEIERINRKLSPSLGFVPFPLPEGVLLDPVYSSGKLSALDVYRILLAESQQPPQPPEKGDEPGDEPGQPGDEPGDEPGQPGDEPGEGEGEGDEPGEGEGEGDEPGEGEGEGDEPGQPGDEPGEGEGDKPGQPGKGRPGTAGSDDVQAPAPEAGETQEQAETATRDLVEAVKLNHEFDRKAGIAGGLGQRDLAAKADAVGLDWRTILRDFVDASARTGWERPYNPQLWSAAGLIGAGRAKRSIGELVVAVDTSGSLPDKALQAILAEIGEISREVQLERVVIVPHDSRVYKPIEIEPGQPAPDRLPGGGGTLFGPVLRWIEENAPDAIGVVWITDGDASDWDAVKAPAVPVLWGHIPNYWFQPERYPFGSVFEVPVGI